MTNTTLSRETVDRLLEDHFRREAEGDVPGTLATFTDDVVHDVVGDPAGELQGPAAVGKRYGELFANVKGERADVKHRLYGENFVVDESLWRGRAQGRPFGLEGRNRPLEFRLLHVVEFAGETGQIRRENVWIDLAAIQRQLPQDQSLPTS